MEMMHSIMTPSMPQEIVIEDTKDFKREIFDLTLDFETSQQNAVHHNARHHLVRVHNITSWTKQITPRRKYVKHESSQIYLKHLLVLTLPHHIRPGTLKIPELSWLNEPGKLKQCYHNDCLAHFTKYCEQPVEFLLSSDNHFTYLMKDPYCFEHHSIETFAMDFIQAYQQVHEIKETFPTLEFLLATLPTAMLDSLRSGWKNSFHPELELEDLIKSSFLQLPHHL